MSAYKHIATLPREIWSQGDVYLRVLLLRTRCLFVFSGERAALLWVYQMQHDSPTRFSVLARLQRCS
jgi:hypothetical protein